MNKSSIGEKIKKILESVPIKIFGFFSAFVGFVLDILGVFGVTHTIIFVIGTILFSFGFLVIVIILYLQSINIKQLIVENKSVKNDNDTLKGEINNLNKKYDGLLELAYNGMEFTYNSVLINFNKANSMYSFQFEKHFKIITDIEPEYYSAQFYANKYITDRDKAKDFYEKNKISWNNLHVRSCVSYKLPSEEKFSDDKYLEIVNISDNSNYIPFKIMYKVFNRGTKVELTKGTEVKMKYCYNVPIELWGSYINRTISYFGEEAKVILKFDSKSELKYEIVKLKEGYPVELENTQYDEKKGIDEGKTVITICFKCKANECNRFRVKWDAEKYFGKGNLNTVDGIDQLGITNK